MRIITKTFTVEYKQFEVGEIVRRIGEQTLYKVSIFFEPLESDQPAIVWLEGHKGAPNSEECASFTLNRLPDGTITLEDKPIKQWFTDKGIIPTSTCLLEVLADTIGLTEDDALALNNGWMESTSYKDLLVVRHESTVLWELGHDAWLQASTD